MLLCGIIKRMKRKLKSQRGQVILEYMLLIAIGVIGIVIAMKAFNDNVIGAISEGITKKVAKHCSGCTDK